MFWRSSAWLPQTSGQKTQKSAFESGIFPNDPDALQDHCVLCNNVENLRVEIATYT